MRGFLSVTDPADPHSSKCHWELRSSMLPASWEMHSAAALSDRRELTQYTPPLFHALSAWEKCAASKLLGGDR